MKPFQLAHVPPEERQLAIESFVNDWINNVGDTRKLEPNATTAEQAREAITKSVDDMQRNEQTWINDKYQVAIRDVGSPVEGWPDMLHLSIKRRDRAAIHDWRELQQIKNMLVGPENEGCEIYPAESRLVDTSNQYHLWVLKYAEARWPFGFPTRCVVENPSGKAVQRPFEKEEERR